MKKYREEFMFDSWLSDKSPQLFIEEFKRHSKELHYRYQADLDLKQFWLDINKICLHLLNGEFRCAADGKFPIADSPLSIAICDIIELVMKISSTIQNGEKYDFSDFKKVYQTFLEKVNISVLTEEPTTIKIFENPKYFFQGWSLETERRIVAFVDILGFKEIIQEYDNNPKSITLRTLHQALFIDFMLPRKFWHQV